MRKTTSGYNSMKLSIDSHFDSAKSIVADYPELINHSTSLIEGGDVDTTNPGGQTALHVACSKNSLELVNTLLEKDADVDKQDGRGWTPLMIAAQKGNEPIVRALLEKQPCMALTDKFGKTACDRAATNSIFYLLQSAAIDQRIERSSKGVNQALGISNTRREKSADTVRRQDLEENPIIDYYKQQIAERIKKVSSQFSLCLRETISRRVKAELQESESLLKDLIGGDLNELTERMKQQIDQHIGLKIKLAAAKAGIKDFEMDTPPLKYSLSSVRIQPNKSEKESSRVLPPKNMNFSFPRMPEVSNLQFKKPLHKNSQENFKKIQKDLEQFTGKQISQLAQRLANEQKKQISSAMKKEMETLYERLKTEILDNLSMMGYDLKTKVDLMIRERMTRVTKRMKERLDVERSRLSAEIIRKDLLHPEPISERILQASSKQLEKIYTDHEIESQASANIKKSVRPPRKNEERNKTFSIDKKVSNDKSKLSVASSLQVAKESPIAQSVSTKNMLDSLKKPSIILHEAKSPDKEASSLDDKKLENLYKQYANVFGKSTVQDPATTDPHNSLHPSNQ